jgi:hypothetical protein
LLGVHGSLCARGVSRVRPAFGAKGHVLPAEAQGKWTWRLRANWLWPEFRNVQIICRACRQSVCSYRLRRSSGNVPCAASRMKALVGPQGRRRTRPRHFRRRRCCLDLRKRRGCSGLQSRCQRLGSMTPAKGARPPWHQTRRSRSQSTGAAARGCWPAGAPARAGRRCPHRSRQLPMRALGVANVRDGAPELRRAQGIPQRARHNSRALSGAFRTIGVRVLHRACDGDDRGLPLTL